MILNILTPVPFIFIARNMRRGIRSRSINSYFLEFLVSLCLLTTVTSSRNDYRYYRLTQDDDDDDDDNFNMK